MRSARVTAVVTAMLAGAGGAAHADAVYISGRAETLAPGGSGGGLGAEWHRALPRRWTMRLGASGDTLPGARWGAGSAGLTMTAGRAMATMDASVGHSSLDGAYWQLRGSAILPMPRGWLLSTGAHGVGGGTARGLLLEAGLTVPLASSLTAHAAVYESVTGTLGTRLAAAKLVLARGGRRYLAGAAIGRSVPTLLGLRDESRTQTLGQVFAGVVFPMGKGGDELLVTLERYDLETSTRLQVSFGWKLALH
jgi:hypothetical protein